MMLMSKNIDDNDDDDNHDGDDPANVASYCICQTIVPVLACSTVGFLGAVSWLEQ